MVGWEPRRYTRDVGKGGTVKFSYLPNGVGGMPKHYSLVLTGEAFIHVGYLEMFSSPVNERIHKMIDSLQNCEDISMNVVIGHHLRSVGQPMPSGMYVKLVHPVRNLETKAGKLRDNHPVSCWV